MKPFMKPFRGVFLIAALACSAPLHAQDNASPSGQTADKPALPAADMSAPGTAAAPAEIIAEQPNPAAAPAEVKAETSTTAPTETKADTAAAAPPTDLAKPGEPGKTPSMLDGPVAAQTPAEPAQPQSAAADADAKATATEAAKATIPESTPAKPAPAKKPKTAAKKPKPAPTDTTTSTAPEGTSTQPAAKPARKKAATASTAQHSSGAAIVKEGGKTCSGQDEFRVCW